MYKQKKSHIPQMLRDSATSWGHRWRIKAFTAHRPIKRQKMKMYEKVVENRVLEQHIACNNIICKHTVQSVVIQEEKQAD